MIQYQEQDHSFYLHTNHTTYVMYINPYKHLEHVYYGQRIEPFLQIEDQIMKYDFELGSSTSYQNEKGYMLQHRLFELGTYGSGDYREPTIHAELGNGSRLLDFKVVKHEMLTNVSFQKMPQATKKETLCITLEDESNLQVKLYYTVYEDTDVIIRNMEILNQTDAVVTLDRALSMNFDMLHKNYMMTKMDGAWIRERHLSKHQITSGILKIDSKKGVSSSDHNPFIIIHDPHDINTYGDAYGFGLIYSGNFEANIECTPHNLLRVNMGINSFDFRYPLDIQETFVTPEVILTFSASGIQRMTTNLHRFINEFVIKNPKQTRPILVNNWEATYFDFNEKKILAIAKKASKLGIELFCLDDGWFGKRNDDYSSLGDWYYNRKKLPSGVSGLCKKINKLGLDFGLWVEPEMVNEDSNLYKEHPDWVIKVPNRTPSKGRNQLILDLSNPEVVQYLKNTLVALFQSANITYVKWDMNRNFSDVYSSYLDNNHQGQLLHKYTLGLYDVLDHITNECPNILFESCSSGGNRFDMGMLYYMPQTWTSDNTDAYERCKIQEGTSIVYPLSSISNHVSGNRSHQTLRHTPLESRFNIAAFGVLGYELDLTTLTPYEYRVIQKQITFYKQYRDLFLWGEYQCIQSIYSNNLAVWSVHNDTTAIVMVFQDKAIPNPPQQSIRLPFIKEDMVYSVKSRTQYQNIRVFGSLIKHVSKLLKDQSWLHQVITNRYMMSLHPYEKQMTGKQLQAKLLLDPTYTGTGYEFTGHTSLMPDYGSRMFVIERG